MDREGLRRLVARPVVVAGLLVAAGGLGYWLGAEAAEEAAEDAADEARDDAESYARYQDEEVRSEVEDLADRVEALERKVRRMDY